MLEFLKALFGDGEALTFDQLKEKAEAAKINAVNLADGGYVSVDKHNDKVKQLTDQVTALTEQVSQRDTDLTDLQGKLTAAQADATKLGEAQTALTQLQAQYATEKTELEGQLARQAYEMNIRDLAGKLRFSSTAAKKAFIQEAVAKDFKREGDTLLGYEEFVTKYKADDPDAFIPDEPAKEEPHQDPPPQFVAPTSKTAPAGGDNPFNFGFSGIRPKPQE